MDRVPTRARILIVDDEAPIREYEANLPSEFGHEVLTASEGYEALKLVREKRPDLALLDIMMPEISGAEVCRQLRADPRTRVAGARPSGSRRTGRNLPGTHPEDPPPVAA